MTLAPTAESLINRIIVPLDVPSESAAIALIDALPQVTFWKVGLELFVSSGPAILSQLKSRGKRIFLDLKLHDIPNTMAGAGRAAGRYGVELLTVHAAAGGIALRAVQQAAIEGAQQSGESPPNVIAITLLTSIGPEALTTELKVSLSVEAYAEQMAQLAKDSGLAGAVCSPHEAAKLRKLCGKDFRLVCPGVRPSWAQKGDQQRTMTPSEALQAGADYLVIGRPITQAADPAAAIARLCTEMAA
ncbi:orotidine-5'-phosphate decarboxylase [cf. Phormidesmis sp. LEGE 11477]|uniref:orotidine-5'-phosphate decarboxylase n=1 Tax=cf. Phormidesmis sp. LEGE 11477 TaxID=1828680 RepID=UPI001882EEEE|nr:orotidine-5'-phosphate decarboxylase [cf. Phormidesmis sp. LEGE 11477]MBE9059461.1 orotidine-5'-phosphate decarboxylase [cf. Phormidesmis sp. LEGE 11477]